MAKRVCRGLIRKLHEAYQSPGTGVFQNLRWTNSAAEQPGSFLKAEIGLADNNVAPDYESESPQIRCA